MATQQPKDPWDPFWSYVLDDYSDYEDARKERDRRIRFGRSKSQRQQVEEQPQKDDGMFGFFQPESSSTTQEKKKTKKKGEAQRDDRSADSRQFGFFSFSESRLDEDEAEARKNSTSSEKRERPSASFSKQLQKIEKREQEQEREDSESLRHPWRQHKPRAEPSPATDKWNPASDTLMLKNTESAEQTNIIKGPRRQKKMAFFRRSKSSQNLQTQDSSTMDTSVTTPSKPSSSRGAEPSGRNESSHEENRSGRKKKKAVPYTESSKRERPPPAEKDASFGNLFDIDVLALAERLDPWGYSTSYSDDESGSFITAGASVATEDADDSTCAESIRTTSTSGTGVTGATGGTFHDYTEIRLKHRPVMDNVDNGSKKGQVIRHRSRLQAVLLERTKNLRESQLEDPLDMDAPAIIDGLKRDAQITAEVEKITEEQPPIPAPMKSWELEQSKEVTLEEGYPASTSRAALLKSSLGKVVCCSVKNYKYGSQRSEDDQKTSAGSDEMFPKLRVVTNEGGASTAAVLSAGNGFAKDIPAALQDRNIPHSLYQYEYDSGSHMDVVYNNFGKDPRSLLTVRWHDHPPKLRAGSMDAIVQVEASTISETDCAIRRGGWFGDKKAVLPNVPGVDVVGKLFKIDKRLAKRYDLQLGDRVISLTGWGGNSRFCVVPVEDLVRVPDDVDPAEAACLAQGYLSAFQVLHFGQTGLFRYRKKVNKGKTVLILGALTNSVGRATIDLARQEGIVNIYATAKKKHFGILRSMGVLPLSRNPADWLRLMEKQCDLVLAIGEVREDVTADHFRTLRNGGNLILVGRRLGGSDIPVGNWDQSESGLMCSSNRTKAKMMNRTHSYDLFDVWERHLDSSKKDLEHLLRLLQGGTIKPNLLERVPLSKVGRAQELVEAKRLSGFIVCEPWLQSKQRALYL